MLQSLLESACFFLSLYHGNVVAEKLFLANFGTDILLVSRYIVDILIKNRVFYDLNDV